MSLRPDYSTKAYKYVQFRWEYAAEAVQAIFHTAGLTSASVVADIGAGTGKLSRHFLGRVRKVYAVEPDTEMRRMAEEIFYGCADCVVLDGTAEAIPLPDGIIDLITVAQAIHWFDPIQTRFEFMRVMKPSGWLALVRNYGIDSSLNQAIESLMHPEWFQPAVKQTDLSLEELALVYFGGLNFAQMAFPFYFQQDWISFLGALTTTPGTLDEDHPDFPAFASAAQEVFERFSQGGWMDVHGETELVIGRPE